MFLIRSLTRLGSSMPGSWTRMRSLPWRAISGSATPNSSMRLRIVSTACATALSSITRRDGSFRLKVHLPPPRRVRPVGQEPLDGVFELGLVGLRRDRDGERRSPSGAPRRRARRPSLRAGASRAASSRSAFTASAVLTCRTRWMPPRRSRPSLIAFFRASRSGGPPGPVHSFFACWYPVENVAGDRAHHDEDDQKDAPAKLLTQVSSASGKKERRSVQEEACQLSASSGRSTRPTREGTSAPAPLPSKSLSCL